MVWQYSGVVVAAVDQGGGGGEEEEEEESGEEELEVRGLLPRDHLFKSAFMAFQSSSSSWTGPGVL